MCKYKSRKAFTLIELVIVIAVIAVLAAVLIPTFAGIIENANRSKDLSAMGSFNSMIAAAAPLHGHPASLDDALELLGREGYTLAQVTELSSKGTMVVWNQKDQCFQLAIVNEDDMSMSIVNNEKADDDTPLSIDEFYIWVIVNDKDTYNKYKKTEYSIYLNGSFPLDETELTVTNGFSIGNNTNSGLIKVTYKAPAGGEGDEPRTVCFVLPKGCDFTVQNTGSDPSKDNIIIKYIG